MEKVFGFFSCGIEGKPAFIVRMSDSLSINAIFNKPCPDFSFGLLGRLESRDDFFRRPMLAEIGRSGVGSKVGLDLRSQEAWKALTHP